MCVCVCGNSFSHLSSFFVAMVVPIFTSTGIFTVVMSERFEGWNLTCNHSVLLPEWSKIIISKDKLAFSCCHMIPLLHTTRGLRMRHRRKLFLSTSNHVRITEGMIDRISAITVQSVLWTFYEPGFIFQALSYWQRLLGVFVQILKWPEGLNQ